MSISKVKLLSTNTNYSKPYISSSLTTVPLNRHGLECGSSQPLYRKKRTNFQAFLTFFKYKGAFSLVLAPGKLD